MVSYVCRDCYIGLTFVLHSGLKRERYGENEGTYCKGKKKRPEKEVHGMVPAAVPGMREQLYQYHRNLEILLLPVDKNHRLLLLLHVMIVMLA